MLGAVRCVLGFAAAFLCFGLGERVEAAACGNGVLEAGEGCDDGGTNGAPGDPCDATCKINNGDACNATAPGSVGNASCESGLCNTQGLCVAANVCGNGVLDATEGCDDGGNNGAPGDACDASCTIVDGHECNAGSAGLTGNASCESGICNTNGIASPGLCAAANVCGNGVLDATEGCDRGDNDGTSTSLCDASCKIVDGQMCNTLAPGLMGSASCESGTCSADGDCVTAGTCDVDADCTDAATPTCNMTTHACEASPSSGSGCGCASSDGPSGAEWLMLALVAVVLRRRRPH